MDLHEIPELPEDKADKVKKNFWVYVLWIASSVVQFWLTDYFKEKDNKNCLEMNLYYIRKLDSTDQSNILYMRQNFDLTQKNNLLQSKMDTVSELVHYKLLPPAKKIINNEKAKH